MHISLFFIQETQCVLEVMLTPLGDVNIFILQPLFWLCSISNVEEIAYRGQLGWLTISD
jgi:hypothetical protein